MTDGGVRETVLIGWQTLLADLSLILFMVTAAAMSAGRSSAGSSRGSSAQGASKAPSQPKAPCDQALGEPLALWRAGGSQTLRRWLSSEQPDPRQQLTITAYYRRGAQVSAMSAAQALVNEAGAMGRGARVIVAPATDADSEETLASLAYDRPPGAVRAIAPWTPAAGMAQGLRDRSGNALSRNLP
jgi:hypothetical protein